LTVFTSIFFIASNLSGTFITIYFRNIGLSILEIAIILLITFIIIGLLPLSLLKTVKNFERIIRCGVFSTMLFYIALIFIKHPIILGLAYGMSIATFWPSFNLLQFRLSETKMRARTLSLFSSVIPSLASIIGPVIGGFIIQNFSFEHLFATVIFFYFAAFLLSTKIEFKSEHCKFQIPFSRKFTMFFVTFIFWGFIESYWIAYPLFVYTLSGNALFMGFVYSFSAIMITILNFLINWLSDVKLTRVKYTKIGAILYALWYFAIAYSTSMYQIVILSVISGLASAFSLSWLAYYGDSFERKFHASILVIMEIGLMIGRIANLAPAYIFVAKEDYTNYFTLLGISSLFLFPILAISKRYRENTRN